MELSLHQDLAERRTFLDPARGDVGQLKAGLARSAIVTIARDHMNRIWVLNTWAQRASTDAIISELVRHWTKWSPGKVGIEDIGQQKLFVSTVKTILRMKGIHMPLEGYGVNTHEKKVYRIRTVLQPLIASHRLFVRSTDVELRAELGAFPTGQTIDLVDALASAVNMLPTQPILEESIQFNEIYREHLRDCGLSDDEIRDRLIEDNEADEPLDPFRR